MKLFKILPLLFFLVSWKFEYLVQRAPDFKDKGGATYRIKAMATAKFKSRDEADEFVEALRSKFGRNAKAAEIQIRQA